MSLRARVDGADGRPIVILGISAGNVRHLREGKPMLIDLKAFGLDGRLVILYGETEDAIQKQLLEEFKVSLPAETQLPRCSAKQSDRGVPQCSLELGHGGRHKAGFIMWDDKEREG